MKQLVVVESPSKTKKLASFLGKDFTVVSSVGHVRDLPKSGLAIDVEHGFEPSYVVNPEKTDVVAMLKKEAKTAETIYLATDPDREGEAIAWHVGFLMNGEHELEDDPKNDYLTAQAIATKSKKPHVYRVTFNSITKEAVLEAFEHPRKLDTNLVNAQQARRVLDRLVGYELSPLLWKKIRYGLSAGRVQSVAVRFVVEREREIEAFAKNPYFELTAEFETKGEGAPKKSASKAKTFPAKLVKIDQENIYEKKKHKLFAGEYEVSYTTLDSADKVVVIREALQKGEYRVQKVDEKLSKVHPSAPFTTASLQQAASSKLGYSPARTMRFAQKLYENGHITYMRTDSIHIVPEFVKEIRGEVTSQFGTEYLLPKERFFSNKKSLNTQEAHEAIHPTHMNKTPDTLGKSATPEETKLYSLIFSRTIATQMAAAVYSNTKVIVESTNLPKVYTFHANGSVLQFDGFLKAYGKEVKDTTLPPVKADESVDLHNLTEEEKMMTPPPRYTESSLVKELEKFGVGRPSTYASILSTIQARGYVKNENKRLYPTDNGMVVNDLLVTHFPKIVDVDFTAEMEGDLDEVALGNINWRTLMKEFYGPFSKTIKEKDKEIKKSDIVQFEKTDEKCPECKKGTLIVKLGKFGKFLSCDAYPDCKYARPIEKDSPVSPGEQSPEDRERAEKEQVEIDAILQNSCPEDGGKLILKSGRFGRFVACENYPKCKYTKSIQPDLKIACPKCGEIAGGKVVMKRTKKGRNFYGCSRYPDCDFASWKKPE